MRVCRICLSLLLIFTGVCSAVVAADQAQKSGPLSLSDCISIALSHNTDVLTAKNNVTAAKNRSASAISEYLPQISIQNNAFVWGAESVLSTTTTGTAFNVTQSIFDGGVREANVQSARYGVKQYNAGLSRTQQQVVYSVSNAYYELLRARHLAEVAEANVTYNEGLRDQILACAEEGEAAKVDVLPIEAQLASARVSLLSAKNTVRTSAIDLENLIGLDIDSSFDVQDVEDMPNVEIKPLGEYLTSALKARPDILQAQAATGASKASVRSARIALYPRPIISANYQREIQGGFTNSSTQMVGGITFDLFNGGANRAAYREAKANQANAKLQEQQTIRDICSDVEQAHLNLTSAKERMAASALSLEAATSNYEAQKERYSQGLGTTLDLLNAEVQLITAKSDDVQARYDYLIAIAQIDYATGEQGGVK